MRSLLLFSPGLLQPPDHFTLASPPAAARTSSEPFHARLASGCGSHFLRTISRSPRLRLRLALPPNHFTPASPPAAAPPPSQPLSPRPPPRPGPHPLPTHFTLPP